MPNNEFYYIIDNKLWLISCFYHHIPTEYDDKKIGGKNMNELQMLAQEKVTELLRTNIMTVSMLREIEVIKATKTDRNYKERTL